IYIDPPYNTGNKDWVYNDHYVGANDRWRHSQWLEFLFRRLTLARDLLTPDGVILVSINDENRARLELLMDEVFPGRRLGTITWRTRQGSNADQQCFLSVDHEHVLVYGNSGFSFNGFGKSYEMYGNPDKDPRGDWRIGDITLGFSHKERPNLYYPLLDPETGTHYPCSPESVWRYATEARVKEGQQLQAKTMEEFVRLGQIVFPSNPRVETWPTMEALLTAIDNEDVPKGGKSLLLRRDLPNLEFWVGRPVGFGRPQFKRYKADLRNQTQPLSSWVVPNSEAGDYEAESSFVAGSNQEGARVVAEIFGDRAFNYAKPLSLIKNLLQQATRPGDIVLDFFAGSGTTGHAVLELNAEDGASNENARSFILCSSSEATSKEREKNLCRDVCAERIRRVMQGVGGKAGLGGAFAYLQLDLIEAADLPFEATPEHAGQMLALRLYGSTRPVVEVAAGVRLLGLADDCAHLLLPEVNAGVLDRLQQWLPESGAARLAIWSPRPESLRVALAGREIEANCYGLLDALMRGQGAGENRL
ncbi:MAG: site-specific DNA-methyltransferase, partial [Betaproteobacteria bacterium]|nr:site-specific DNA-methyltransferase [Betaproteobacteria bacterium]